MLDLIAVVKPAPVAISAAMSFVSIAPVPRLEPSVDVLTVASLQLAKFGQNPQDFRSNLCDGSYDVHLSHSWVFRGFAVYNPSTSVRRKR